MSKSLTALQFAAMTKEDIKELLEVLELMNSADFARALGWSVKKVSVYNDRGKLPAPIVYIGGRPIWTKEQIEKYIKTRS